MPYNNKQYEAALDFFATGDDNITDPWDLKRIQAYDYYEDLYINATQNLALNLRGEDQVPLLVPNARKIVEATHRFLGKNLDYFVDATGDGGAQEEVDKWWKDFYKREAIRSKFESNKRWGLIRGDACFYVYAKPQKTSGKRLCIEELDPRFVFEINESPHDAKETSGYHIVEKVQDFREEDKPDKQIAKVRTFRKVYDETGAVTGVTSELKYYEIGKWDDRTVKAREDQEPIPGNNDHPDEDPEFIGSESVPITNLPIYKWRTRAPQNSSWGHSILTGLETLLYAINQSLTDEDLTIVFQGLGMYVTTAGRPRDDNGNPTAWNIGPKQVIEIGQEQDFKKVTGVDSVTPFQDHMNFIDEKGISESSGTPEIAIGRVDVAVAESGISLQLQMMPLLASNSELELEMINVLDQMHHDITTQWLPAYEVEMFGEIETMAELTVVVLFDDPMPKNRDTEITETQLLYTNNMILTVMMIQKLRDLGWRWPTHDASGMPLTDDDLALMLNDQQAQQAIAMDPFSAGGGAQGGETVDEQGNPVPNTPDEQVIDLGTTTVE
jgi:hypothetical protein